MLILHLPSKMHVLVQDTPWQLEGMCTKQFFFFFSAFRHIVKLYFSAPTELDITLANEM